MNSNWDLLYLPAAYATSNVYLRCEFYSTTLVYGKSPLLIDVTPVSELEMGVLPSVLSGYFFASVCGMLKIMDNGTYTEYVYELFVILSELIAMHDCRFAWNVYSYLCCMLYEDIGNLGILDNGTYTDNVYILFVRRAPLLFVCRFLELTIGSISQVHWGEPRVGIWFYCFRLFIMRE